jgi:hypothetical protein
MSGEGKWIDSKMRVEKVEKRKKKKEQKILVFSLIS